MNHMDEKKQVSAGRRQGDRRVATASDYTGPERRQGERRISERRSEPRSS